MNNHIYHKLLRQSAKVLLGLFALTSLSCERDTFYIDDIKPGEPVDVLLGFELPQKDQVAVTRTLTDKEEHEISDFYLLIFNEAKEKIFGKYYTLEEMQGKMSYEGGTWSSVVNHKDDMKQANSTHGYVLAKAVTGKCYIFGFANIGSANDETMAAVNTLEGAAVKVNLKEDLQSTRYKLDHLKTLDQLYEVQMDAMSSAKTDILIRDTPNLLYSGAWRKYEDPLSQDKEYKGLVDIDALKTADPSIVNNGNIDLRQKGMIYLRTLTAHVNFHININSDVFTAFEPESWQVVNLPQRVYLMDQGNNTPEKRAEIDFKESAVMTNSMIHDNGMFSFDFWMFENHKKARTASGTDLKNSLDYARIDKTPKLIKAENEAAYAENYLPNQDEITSLQNYYKDKFGDNLDQWETSVGNGTPLEKLKTVYGYGSKASGKHTNYGYDENATADDINDDAKAQFLYAKRELQAKRTTQNTAVWNREGDRYLNAHYDGFSDEDQVKYTTLGYSSKKFVYADDKATYVIIKGRLRLKNTTAEGFNLINYGKSKDGDYLNSKADIYHDGYADVTYTIHLGNINKSIDDFNCLRNTEYNYTVTINGINSIYTTVESNIEQDGGTQYRVKKQPGADGMLNLARGYVYNTDAHFCQFNMMLTKAGLNDFYFEMHTPWNIFTTNDFYSEEFEDWDYDGDGNRDTQPTKRKSFIDIYNTIPQHMNNASAFVPDYDEAAKERVSNIVSNPDFTWFKFAPAIDQSGMFDDDVNFTPAKEETYKRKRATVKYDTSSPKLWNLYTFSFEMQKLIDEINNLYKYRSIANENGKQFAGDNFTQEELDYYDQMHPDAKLSSFNYRVRASVDSPLGDVQYSHFLNPSIYRMFYTVYLDEYYYHEKPYGVTDWSNPYWKHFANQTSRFVNFGYHSTGEASSVNGYILSPDKQSGVMVTQLTVVQPSIQTFYSTDNTYEDEVAIGLEHVNETHDPRWTDLGTWSGHEISTTMANETEDYKSYNGWENAIYYVNKDVSSLTGGTTLWDYYVSDLTYDDHNGLQNNVAMRRSGNTITLDIRKRTGSSRNDVQENPYLAGAIRMCLNRNRDENGDGKIDEEELKWFLPTARQYELSNLGHFSLQDPLLEYNDYVLADGSQRLPYKSVADNELWEFRYVTSDYQMLAAEQMTNSPDYTGANWVTSPYNMRCMRNLGGETARNGDGSTQTNISSNSQSLVFTYDQNDKVFTVNLFDSRSLRSIYYDAEEMPEHYLFSATNLPYRKFKVAKDPKKVDITGYTTFKDLIENLKPCQSYSEDLGKSDLGSWRVPNQAEQALMVMQLRQYNEDNGSHKVEEGSNPWFFLTSGGADTNFLTGTSWNFTGYWGRMITGNHDSEGWGMHMTGAQPNNDNIKNGTYTTFTPSKLDSKTYYVRCVKDIIN